MGAAERRVASSLRLLRKLERGERALPRARPARQFLTLDRAVLAADLARDASELVPRPLRGPLRAESEGVRRIRARVAADVITVAKFDLGEELKLRAHYVEQRLTIAVAPPAKSNDGVGNAVRAHEVISAFAPDLGPALVADGRTGRRSRYLVEEWVDGIPVLTATALAEGAADILAGLAQIHRGYGVHSMGLAQRWGQRFLDRWAATRASGVLPETLGERVSALIAEDRTLRVSWTHGDVVASNVLRTSEGKIVLVDWEHSREDVLIRDAAKVHLFSAAPEQTLEQVLDLHGHDPGPGAYSTAEELALAHAHLLSGYPTRRAALEGHPRAEVYERQARRQVELLERVLDRS